ncbi:hypothetical protein CQW23_04153 [Capsicum baccatum]|uniref:Uncharacterized protein n=1 Tax=Capsicum baccatum TaxID=33114 RepID=A0A2G2XDV3_CAPBA|nr:hypothetical protein CQW23_04153 [Capsicum baccatum]
MSYALQIWWYECCATVDESLVFHVHNLIPRMVNWKVVKPKPRYEDLMDDIFSKIVFFYRDTFLVYWNLTPTPQELNYLELSNPLMFGPTNHDVNVAQAIFVQQQSERTAPTKFGDEFDDFSTPPNADFLKKMRFDSGPSSHPPVAQYPLYESEKGIPDREGDPPQSLNEHKMDAKCDNVVHDVGQSSKDSEEALHNTDGDLSKAITLYVPPLTAAYPTGITDITVAAIDTCDRQGNTDSQCYISDNTIAAIS